MEESETKPQPKVELDLESIVFQRSDGKTTRISLIEDILAKNDAHGAVMWIVLMKLQELSEIQAVQLEAMQALLQLAGRKPEMPDANESIRTALAAVGLKPEDLAGALKQAGMGSAGPNGVSLSHPGKEG